MAQFSKSRGSWRKNYSRGSGRYFITRPTLEKTTTTWNNWPKEEGERLYSGRGNIVSVESVAGDIARARQLRSGRASGGGGRRMDIIRRKRNRARERGGDERGEQTEGREGLEEPSKGGWNERGEESEVLSCQEEILSALLRDDHAQRARKRERERGKKIYIYTRTRTHRKTRFDET